MLTYNQNANLFNTRATLPYMLWIIDSSNHQINPKIKFEVFIHKSDSINEDQKIDNIREMTHRINRKLMSAGRTVFDFTT